MLFIPHIAQLVPQRLRSVFDDLAAVVIEDENFVRLRDELSQRRSFCVPYLGMWRRVYTCDTSSHRYHPWPWRGPPNACILVLHTLVGMRIVTRSG